MSESVTYHPIGVIHTPYTKPEESPVQPVFAKGTRGTVEVSEEYVAGLDDLDGYSHIFLLFDFHLSKNVKLKVKPFLDTVERGVFSTRAPCRPNHIGFSVVKLIKRDGNILHVEDVDVLDGTPLLDIKPYVARFDHRENTRNGWQDSVSEKQAKERGENSGRSLGDA